MLALRRIANFTEIGSVPITFGGGYSVGPSGQQIPNALDRATALLCNGCNQGIVVVEEEWVGDHPAREVIKGGGTITWRGVHWWPPPSRISMTLFRRRCGARLPKASVRSAATRRAPRS